VGGQRRELINVWGKLAKHVNLEGPARSGGRKGLPKAQFLKNAEAKRSKKAEVIWGKGTSPNKRGTVKKIQRESNGRKLTQGRVPFPLLQGPCSY